MSFNKDSGRIISAETFEIFMKNNELAPDGNPILSRTDDSILCKYCSQFSVVQGIRGNYSQGAHPRSVSQLQKHLSSPNHIHCEEKWKDHYNVLFFEIYFLM
jgi:hypothetical protein